MAVVVDLPYCVQCGAAPKKRRQPSCAYCGAVLPWELWDELSKRRVEITPVQETALENAMARARRSASAPRARSRARIRRMRSLRRRENRYHRTPKQDEADQTVMTFIMGGLVVLAGMGMLLSRYPIIGSVVVLVVAQTAWLISRAVTSRRHERTVRRRRAKRRHGEARIAASVLAVSQPELTPGTESHWQRIVTLHVSRGHQRVLLAKADVGIRAGDTGVASVLGNELVDFRVHENVADRASA